MHINKKAGDSMTTNLPVHLNLLLLLSLNSEKATEKVCWNMLAWETLSHLGKRLSCHS